MTAWPTLKEVRTLLRLQPDPAEDGLIQTALNAAIDYGVGRMGTYQVDNGDGTFSSYPNYPPDATDVPDRAHEACLMHASRLYKRRDTIDGTLGVGDLGVVRIGRFDSDIDSLYGSCAPMVFG